MSRWIVWVMALIVAGALGNATARAAQDDRTWSAPVFPKVDPEKTAADNLEFGYLGIIRAGNQEWRAFRGKYRDFVSNEDFLVTVGRPDLASKLISSRRMANLLAYGGGAATVTGSLFFLADVTHGGVHPPVYLSLALVVGGLGCWIASDHFGGSPATQDEVQEWADRYNDRLRNHIDPQLSPDRRGALTRASLDVAPWVDGRGGQGLSAQGRF